MVIKELTKETINEAIKAQGFNITEDDHILELRHGDNLVDKFNAPTVTCQAIYNSMKCYLEGLNK